MYFNTVKWHFVLSEMFVILLILFVALLLLLLLQFYNAQVGCRFVTYIHQENAMHFKQPMGQLYYTEMHSANTPTTCISPVNEFISCYFQWSAQHYMTLLVLPFYLISNLIPRYLCVNLNSTMGNPYHCVHHQLIVFVVLCDNQIITNHEIVNMCVMHDNSYLFLVETYSK